MVKSIRKGLAIVLGTIVVGLPALTCWVERFLGDRDAIFLFWGQAFALCPGLPGNYTRKCYYFLTLRRCSLDCEIGFMTYIHDRRAQIGDRVNIGAGVGIGWVCIDDGCLIASRVSILSGDNRHQLDPNGRLTPFDRIAARRIHIGEETWIGEGSIVMAAVKSRCIVGGEHRQETHSQWLSGRRKPRAIDPALYRWSNFLHPRRKTHSQRPDRHAVPADRRNGGRQYCRPQKKYDHDQVCET